LVTAGFAHAEGCNLVGNYVESSTAGGFGSAILMIEA
jgi:hypothetical protein